MSIIGHRLNPASASGECCLDGVVSILRRYVRLGIASMGVGVSPPQGGVA